MLHGLIQSRTLSEVAADTSKRLNPVDIVVAFSNRLECVYSFMLPQAKTDPDDNMIGLGGDWTTIDVPGGRTVPPGVAPAVAPPPPVVGVASRAIVDEQLSDKLRYYTLKYKTKE